MSPDDRLRLRHMIDACEMITRFVRGTTVTRALPALLTQLRNTHPPAESQHGDD